MQSLPPSSSTTGACVKVSPSMSPRFHPFLRDFASPVLSLIRFCPPPSVAFFLAAYILLLFLLSGVYYWQNGSRNDKAQVRLETSDDDTMTEIYITGVRDKNVCRYAILQGEGSSRGLAGREIRSVRAKRQIVMLPAYNRAERKPPQRMLTAGQVRKRHFCVVGF